MQPLIGISGGLVSNNDWSPPIVGHRRGYVDAVTQAGGIPVILPPLTDLSALHALYERLDGVLLAGGDDVDPAYYGEAPHPLLGRVTPERDTAELQLARWAVTDGKPVLGICHGMQVLNVALGGSLWQDIQVQLPGTLDHLVSAKHHRWDALDHTLKLTPDSQLAQLLGTTEIGLNSLHHQAVKEIGAGLRVVGRAPDGVIEAVEGIGAAFVNGVQGHPEQLWQAVEPRWRALFGAFVAAMRDIASGV